MIKALVVVEIYKKYRFKVGLSGAEIYRRYVYPRFFISESTFRRYLSQSGIKEELKNDYEIDPNDVLKNEGD